MFVYNRMEEKRTYSVTVLEKTCAALHEILRMYRTWRYRRMLPGGPVISFFAAILPKFMLDNPQIFRIPENWIPEAFRSIVLESDRIVRSRLLRSFVNDLSRANRDNEELLFQLLQYYDTDEFYDFLINVFERLDGYDFNIEKSPYLLYRAVLDTLPSLFEADDMNTSGEMYLNEEIASLMSEFAKIRAGESVFEGACGIGVLVSIAIVATEAKARGLSAYNTAAVARFMMLMIDKQDVIIDSRETFNDSSYIGGEKGFDLFLMKSPFGFRTDRDGISDHYARSFLDEFNTNPTNDQWLYIRQAFRMLKDYGRGVALMNINALNRGLHQYKDTRMEMALKGYISAVIELPVGSVGSSASKWSIVLFDKCGRHKDIYFLDLSRKALGRYFKRTGKGTYVLDETCIEDISRLVSCREEEAGVARIVSIQELENHDFSLSAGAYLLEDLRKEEELAQTARILLDREEAKRDYEKSAQTFDDAVKVYLKYRGALEHETEDQ